MDWRDHARDWPLAAHSRFVACPPHRWHVQTLGTGPDLVLLHGAGGATQSFRALAPVLARRHRVTMMDFPGQGFTEAGTRQRAGLSPLAEDIRALLDRLGIAPTALIGHSAGAAVALEMALARPAVRVVGINPALSRFEGAAGWLFPLLAKGLVMTPFVPTVLARAAKAPGRLETVLASTGSRLPPEDTRFYRRLIADPAHIEATLSMMAQWQIDGLLARLPGLTAPVLFLAGARDKAVPPRVARRAAARLETADVRIYPGEGHLMHETAPDQVALDIERFLEMRIAQPSSA